MSTKGFARFGGLVSVVTFASALALAQSQANTGIIEGTVSDPSGKAVAKAQMTITNLGTNFTRELSSDEEGRFRGLLLPLGPYRVTTKAPNFGTNVREGMDLAVGQTISLSIVLSISQVEQVVSVSAEAPILESGRVENSTYLDQRSVRDLPNNGRNFLSLVPLTPGVSIVQGPDGDEISINGQKGINNNVSIDGADNNNPFFGEQRGGQRPPFTVSLDAIKEFQVVADSAPAEFGRSSGGFINVVTKSGTNGTHGTLHEYQKWTGLTSRLSDGTRLVGFPQEQFGGTIGGAIRKNKLFYFAAFDQQFFTQTKQNNPNRIDPALVNFFATQVQRPQRERPDHPREQRHRDAGQDRLVRQLEEPVHGALQFRPRAPAQRHVRRRAVGHQRQRHRARFLQHGQPAAQHHALRLHAERSALPVLPRRPSARLHRSLASGPEPSAAGYRYRFRRPVSLRDALLHPGEGSRYALPDQRQRLAGARRAQFQVRRRAQPHLHHADLRRLRQRAIYLRQRQGLHELCEHRPQVRGMLGWLHQQQRNLSRAGASITGPLLLFLQFAGVNGKSTNDAGTQTIAQLEPAIFVQDKWQIRKNLTLSYGLRWDAQIEPDPITPASQVFFAPFIGKPGFPSTGNIPSSKKQFQPRVGLVWSPGKEGKTLVRLGGGIYYARTPGLDFASTRSTNGSVGQSIYRDSTFNGFGLTPPAYDQLVPNASNLPPSDPQVYVTSKDFTNPRTYTWSFNVEQALASDLKVTRRLHLGQDRPRQPLRGPQRPRLRLALEHRVSAPTRPTASAS